MVLESKFVNMEAQSSSEHVAAAVKVFVACIPSSIVIYRFRVEDHLIVGLSSPRKISRITKRLQNHPRQRSEVPGPSLPGQRGLKPTRVTLVLKFQRPLPDVAAARTV